MHSRDTTYMAAMNGQLSRTNSPIFTPVMPQTTDSTTPTGGVSIPTTRLRTKMNPKCSGSMPYCRAMGWEQRHEHDVSGVRFQEHAYDQEHQRDQAEEQERAFGHALHGARETDRQKVDREKEGDGGGKGDHGAHQSGGLRGRQQHVRKVGELEFARDEKAEQERVTDPDCGTLGRSEGPATIPPITTTGHQKHEEGSPDLTRTLAAHAKRIAGQRVVAPPRYEADTKPSALRTTRI